MNSFWGAWAAIVVALIGFELYCRVLKHLGLRVCATGQILFDPGMGCVVLIRIKRRAEHRA